MIRSDWCHVTNHEPLHTVTLPILVSASAARPRDEPDGWVTLFPSADPKRYVVSHSAVRLVTADDIQKRLTPREKVLAEGALRLRQIYAKRDELFLEMSSREIEKSFEQVRACVPMFERGPVNLRGNWPSVRWVYSSLMCNLIQDARLVMWCSDKEQRFLPGVYCSDWVTAAFVLVFMDGIRVCPQCGISFIPETDNQDYCEPRHGVAYRTARSRWRAKQRAKAKVGK